MLRQRLITTLWGLPLVLAFVWLGDPWFTAMVAVAGLLASREFHRMAAARAVPQRYVGVTWTLLFIISPHFSASVPLLLTSGLVASLLCLIACRREDAFAGWSVTIAGILYIGWLLSYLVALRGMGGGREWVSLALLTTFASDTGAYVVGSRWGRHRLAPTISPGKTWEGAIAGLVVGMTVSALVVAVSGLPVSIVVAAVLGLAISVLGQLGGLAFSVIKRSSGVKDAGRVLPGHGGMLDRLDSLLLAGVVVYYFLAVAPALGWL